MTPSKNQEPLPNDNLNWLKIVSDIQRDSISSVEEVAKQLIGLDGIISGIYFGVISFSSIPQQANTVWIRLVFIAPIIFWLISLIASVLTITPRSYMFNPNSPSEAKRTYEKIISTKRLYLSIALWLFVLSVGGLAVAIIVFMNSFSFGKP